MCKISTLTYYTFKICFSCMMVCISSDMLDPVVEVEDGQLKGSVKFDYDGRKYYSFQAIPYAKPPLGHLRFKAPVPPEPWNGIRDATKESSGSIARHFLSLGKIVGSEDCLYLNVYTPELPKNNDMPKRPVMFWIHGGGYVTGPSTSDVYGPDYLMTEKIVLVTISYRLGILGVLRLEDPSLGVPGNAALKDMVMALKWVQKNIEKFGGDPDNVTIFGESAGGSSVHALILSPMAKGLFHRAIIQSASILDSWVFGKEKASTVAKLLGKDLNDEKEILEFLQSVPANEFIKVQDSIPDNFKWNTLRPFGMSVEKNALEPAYLPDFPLNIIQSGNYNKVPILTGYASNEGLYAFVYHETLIEKTPSKIDFQDSIPYSLNVSKGTILAEAIAAKLKENYYGEKTVHLDNTQKNLNFAVDSMSTRCVHKSLKAHLKNLNHPIYLYRFSADTEMNLIKRLNNITLPGASHCDILGYLFKTAYIPECKENSTEELIVRRIVRLWTNFARTGDPNGTGNDSILPVTWKPIQEDNFDCLDIGKELKFIKNPVSERLKVWDEIEELIANSRI